MTRKQFKKLNVGDIVREPLGDRGLVVTANYGSRVTAVRTFDLTNPEEWDLVLKAKHKRPKKKERPGSQGA